MAKRLLAVLIVLFLVIGSAPAMHTAKATEELEPYTFTHYFNYDWWDVAKLQWGVDEASKYFQEKFNITVEFSKPDADPQAKLNVMITSGDLPDSIMMDRGADNKRLAQLGLLVPLEPFMETNPNYNDNILPSTQELLKIDGQIYGIPNWSRKAASGGNEVWMYDQRIWEAAGQPTFATMDDMFNYALKAKNEIKVNEEGLDIIPAFFGRGPEGRFLAWCFLRSYGGYMDHWYDVYEDTYQLAFRDPLFRESTMEINKWFREGLIPTTYFTDSEEQFQEKRVSGRVALMFYDFSQDDSNLFKTILENTFPGDTYEFVDYENPYPPAKGLSYDDIMYTCNNTIGWNVTCITTNAEQPKRIYDLWSFFLTQEAARVQQYGPPGFIWDETDDKGNPILKQTPQSLSEEEYNKLGLWFWMIPGQSDNVDIMKFAINDAMPEDQKSWVITQQAHVLTPKMWLSDEFVGVRDIFNPEDDEHIIRVLCEDYMDANYPKVLMAETEEKANQLFDDIIKFCDDNGMQDVEAKFNAKYQENLELIGGTGLKRH